MRRSAATELGRRHAGKVGMLVALPRLLAGLAVLALVAGALWAAHWLIANGDQAAAFAGDVAGEAGAALLWLLALAAITAAAAAGVVLLRTAFWRRLRRRWRWYL